MKAKAYLPTAAVALALTAFGCRTAEYKAASAIEGTYVRADNQKITLIIQHGHFRQGGEAIYAAGTYSARQLSENKYELKVAYHEKLEGAEGTVIVRKEGDFVYTQDDGEGPETKFKRQ
jgi:hypothetical protein